jgi:hypothetical protein
VASVQGTTVSRVALAHWSEVKRRELAMGSSGAVPSTSDVRNRALAFLISAVWLEKEAASQGVSVSDSQVSSTYQRLLTGPAGVNFAASVRRRGMTNADELRVLRLEMLAQGLRSHVATGLPSRSPAQSRARLAAFLIEYRRRWKQRTTCARGYVIAECREGPPLPTG